MLTYTVYTKPQFNEDLVAHKLLYDILNDCYVNPGVALKYAIDEADTLYCAYYSSILVGFFFHRWKPDYVELNGKTIGISRMILGAVDHNHKNNGIFKYLLEKIQSDIRTNQNNTTYHALYGRTGSILAFRGLSKVFPNIEPNIKGEYSKDGFDLATQISKTYFANSFSDKKNPFALKNTTKHILSDAEREILSRELKKSMNNLFAGFQVDEKEGDRLLYIIKT